MRLLLISNYEPDRQFSMLKYAAWLEANLSAPGLQVVRASAPFVFGRLFPGTGINKWLRYVDKFLLGAAQCLVLSGRVDITHILDHSNSFLALFCRSRRTVITCHDVMAIKAARGAYAQVRIGCSGRLFQRIILACLNRPDWIICASGNTQRELKELLPHAATVVIDNPLNRIFTAAAPSAAGGKNRPYILHLGRSSWYKNREGVLRIFAALRRHERFAEFKLIVVGFPLTGSQRELAMKLGISEALEEIRDPSDEAVDALYSGAACLLFPSLHEGFGWPIIEARALACPVVTSNRPPMSEIAGPHALLIDPEGDPEDIARAIADGWDALQAKAHANRAGIEAYAPDLARERYLAFYRAAAPDVAC